MSNYYTIIFQQDDITGKTGMRVCPDGSLTRRKFFAGMISSKEKAEEIAQDIRNDNPEATVTVKTF